MVGVGGEGGKRVCDVVGVGEGGKTSMTCARSGRGEHKTSMRCGRSWRRGA